MLTVTGLLIPFGGVFDIDITPGTGDTFWNVIVKA
jgi:hypothetical protein